MKTNSPLAVIGGIPIILNMIAIGIPAGTTFRIIRAHGTSESRLRLI
jgi:hypothetical protein